MIEPLPFAFATSLPQPYASLACVGLWKTMRLPTQPYLVNVGDRLGIHAAKFVTMEPPHSVLTTWAKTDPAIQAPTLGECSKIVGHVIGHVRISAIEVGPDLCLIRFADPLLLDEPFTAPTRIGFWRCPDGDYHYPG